MIDPRQSEAMLRDLDSRELSSAESRAAHEQVVDAISDSLYSHHDRHGKLKPREQAQLAEYLLGLSEDLLEEAAESLHFKHEGSPSAPKRRENILWLSPPSDAREILLKWRRPKPTSEPTL